jgi:hypothetical protein
MDELEEDFDNRGTFYCATCWSTWLGEQEQGQDDGWMVEGMTVATLVDMFGNESKVRFQTVLRLMLGGQGETERLHRRWPHTRLEWQVQGKCKCEKIVSVLMSMLTWHRAGEGSRGEVCRHV